MEHQQLSCRITFFNWSIAVPLFVLIGGVYIGGLVHLFPKASNNAALIVVWAVVGFMAVILIPLIASTVRSHLVIGDTGIRERQGVLFSIFSRERTIAWSKIVSWDSSVAFLPLTPGEIPQIKLYTGSRHLRIDKNVKPLLADNKSVTWDHFKRELESLLRSQGVPEATPEPAAMQRRAMKMAFAVVMILIGVLIIVAAVLSVMQGEVHYGLIVAATLLFFLIARAGRKFFRR